MKKIVTIEAVIGENEERKIVWEYTITEHLSGNGEKITNQSARPFDTEEEASAELIQLLNYVLAGQS